MDDDVHERFKCSVLGGACFGLGLECRLDPPNHKQVKSSAMAIVGEEVKIDEHYTAEEDAKEMMEMTTEELVERTNKKRPTMMLVVAGDQEAPAAGFTVNGFDKVRRG